MTYTKNYACIHWLDRHLWSLGIEEQFYLLWPAAVAFLSPRKGVIFALAMICVAPLSRAVEYVLDGRAFTWLSSNADCLLIGALGAYAFHCRRPALEAFVGRWPTVGRAACILLIVGVTTLNKLRLFGAFTVTVGITLEAIAATYLILSCILVARGWLVRILSLRGIVFLGVLSYSLYLWQEFFIAWPSDFNLEKAPFLAFPFNLIGLAAAALASYYLVERPLQGLRAKLRSSKAASP